MDAYGQWQALGLLTDQLLCLEGLCSYLDTFQWNFFCPPQPAPEQQESAVPTQSQADDHTYKVPIGGEAWV